MCKLATRYGDPFGDVKYLRATRIPSGLGGGARLFWEFTATPDPWYKVFQNKVEVSVVQENDAVIYPDLGEQSFFEVLAVGPGNRLADYTHLVQDLPGNKAFITWNGSTSGDADFYRLYNDNKTGSVDFGTVIAEVDHLGSGVAHTYKSGALTDGTWKWTVRAVDDATNEETNVTTVSVVIATYPLAVTDLAYTFNDTTKKVTLTWTASTSSDIANYRIYSNAGSGYVDYDTVVATVAHPTVTWTSGAITTAGTWNYGVRAVDSGGLEELNSDVVVSIELVGSPVSEEADLPNAPTGLEALAVAGAKIQLTWVYNDIDEEATPDTFTIYYDNGSGTVNYVNALDTVLYSTGTTLNKHLTFTFTSAALMDTTTYIFGVRAKDGSDEEANTVTVTATADSTAPNAPTALAGVTTY